MDQFSWMEAALFLVLLTAGTPILGTYIAFVFGEQFGRISHIARMEQGMSRVLGVKMTSPMTWGEYAGALMLFNALGVSFVFIIQMTQAWLPLNPQHLANVSWHSSLNTAISFVTNTDWQGYAGETTMSAFTQMIALAVQNFLSAAVGLATAIALTRGIANRSCPSIGNFWSDLTRGTCFVLLPLSIFGAVVLMNEGVVQNFGAYVTAVTIEGAKQILPMGPVASQVAIKMVGTNGGGYFNANAAHPFENPTALSNFLQMFSIFMLPAALTHAFGRMTNARRHGWLLFAVMTFMFVGLTGLSVASEFGFNDVFGRAALAEGKEIRFGTFESTWFSAVTTSASCGAVNSMHASLSPISGGIAMLNMMLGEVVFGGVGAGLYGMLLFVLLTVFLAGLMVGRTPEYLGKKIEAREMTLVIVALLAPCAAILIGTGISVVLPAGLVGLLNKGPHGFSEILYAFTSAAANNGSGFAGLNANTPYYNVSLAIAMLIGRFAVILPALAVAGSLSAKQSAPPSAGTFEVHTPLFAILLAAVILIFGALTFVPALALGPVVEHFLMKSGQTF